jgi:uncharacterized protein YceK
MCSGCGTIITHTTTASTRLNGAYSGVRFDAVMIPASTVKSPDSFDAPWLIPFCIIDMPLSATLDTVFLPYDLTYGKNSDNSEQSN